MNKKFIISCLMLFMALSMYAELVVETGPLKGSGQLVTGDDFYISVNVNSYFEIRDKESHNLLKRVYTDYVPNNLLLTKDFRYVVYYSSVSGLHFYDLEEMDFVFNYEYLDTLHQFFAISPDCTKLVIFDHEFKVYNLPDFQLEKSFYSRLLFPGTYIAELQFTPDSKFLCVTNYTESDYYDTSEYSFIDLDTEKKEFFVTGAGKAYGVRFINNDEFFGIATLGNHKYSMSKKRICGTFTGHAGFFDVILFDNNKKMLTYSYNKKYIVWDTESTKIIEKGNYESLVNEKQFSLISKFDENLFSSYNDAGDLNIINFLEGKIVKTIKAERLINDKLFVSTDNDLQVLSSDCELIELFYDMNINKLPFDSYDYFQVTPDGKNMYFLTDERVLSIDPYDLSVKFQTKKVKGAHNFFVDSAGRDIAVFKKTRLYVFDGQDGSFFKNKMAHILNGEWGTFTNDSSNFISVGGDGKIVYWDTTHWRKQKKIKTGLHAEFVALSKDNQNLIMVKPSDPWRDKKECRMLGFEYLQDENSWAKEIYMFYRYSGFNLSWTVPVVLNYEDSNAFYSSYGSPLSLMDYTSGEDVRVFSEVKQKLKSMVLLKNDILAGLNDDNEIIFVDIVSEQKYKLILLNDEQCVFIDEANNEVEVSDESLKDKVYNTEGLSVSDKPVSFKTGLFSSFLEEIK